MRAVAVPYVIALILGVIAIGILAYWFVNQGGKTTTEGFKAECQARTFNFCLAWQNQDSTCQEASKKPADMVECPTPNKPECEKIGFCK